MDAPPITVSELLQLIGEATADAYAWRREAERLAARVKELDAQATPKGQE
jgi:hypothetical protein